MMGCLGGVHRREQKIAGPRGNSKFFPRRLSGNFTCLPICGIVTFAKAVASLAQLVEQRFRKAWVAGSNPATGSISHFFLHHWRRSPCTPPENRANFDFSEGDVSMEAKSKKLSSPDAQSEWASFMDAAPVGLFRADTAGRFYYANAAWERLTGLAATSCLGNGWIQAIHPEDRASVVEEWNDYVASGHDFSHEFRFLTPQGSVRWVHCRTVPIGMGAEPVTGHAGAAEDITERMNAEIELRKLHDELEIRVQERTQRLAQANEVLVAEIAERKKAEEDLRSTDNRFKVVARATNDAIWEWDLALNELWWSEGFHNTFGYDPSDNQPDAWANRVHADDRQRVVSSIRSLIHSGGEFWSEEYRFLRHNGEYAYVFDRGYVIHNDESVPIRMIGAMMDITARRHAEDEVKKLNAELERRVEERTRQLEAANKELETFSYSVSHDLRAPLRAIEGFARVLQEDNSSQLDAEGRRHLDIIISSSRQMAILIDDLLTLSRLGRQELRRHLVRMKDLVQRVWNEIEPSVKRPVTLQLETLPDASGDEALLRQVWANLIANAVKFSAARPSPRVTIGSRAEGDQTIYFVTDNGAGFDMKYADKLFGVFQRLHSRDEFDGTGVGLAIVNRLIQRHGGKVWAEAKVGEGATFSFSLPHRPPTEDHVQQQDKPSPS